MPAFPYAPVDLVGDVYLGGQWVPFQLPEGPQPGNQLRNVPASITRGAANEQSKPGPSKCALRLGNRDGRWSPRNPTGPYFGQLQRNVPLRLAIRRERDQFNRTVSNGWGTATTGEPWATGGAGGSVLASDFAVSGGSATHSVPVTSGYRYTYLSNSLYQDCTVAVDCDIDGITDVTGGDLEPGNIMFRGLSSTSYFMVRVVINAAQELSIALHHFTGAVYHSPVVAFSGWAGEKFTVKALIENQSVRVKAWRTDTEPEPYEWTISASISLAAGTLAVPYFGWVGIRSGVASGNSNSKPIVFRYSNMRVELPRFAGEVTKWPNTVNKSRTDAYASIEANGILRRLGQGQAPLQSVLRRSIPTAPGLVAYWPCEDGTEAQVLASAFDGYPNMEYTGGAIQLAQFKDFKASAPIPFVNNSRWYGHVPFYTAVGGSQCRHLLAVPSTGTADGAIITQIYTAGSALRWELHYHAGFGGAISLHAYNSANTQILDSGSFAFNLDGRDLRVSFELTDDGADVDWLFSVLEVGQTVGSFISGTLAGHNHVRMGTIALAVGNVMQQVAIGHISVQSQITSLFDLHAQLNAYKGEAAGVRIQRLCDEIGVPFDGYGNLADTPPMGPQLIDKFLNLIMECVGVDMGTLYEPRGVAGLVYRTRRLTENQLAVLVMSYLGLKPPADPVDDDQNTRNDITVSRKDGSSARARQETGPLSVLPPEQGGVGIYDTQVTLNCWSDVELPYFAAWLRHLGTVDEARYPQLQVDLATSAFRASATLTAAALALDVDDRMTFTDPPAGQAPDPIDQLARGFTEQIGAWLHTITMNCSPASPYNVMVLDDAACRLAPLEDCQLNGNFNAGVSPISVTTPTGPLWTTAAGEMPIAVRLSGENMSATAITGASSPQSFTVTRGTNGVNKNQVDDAQVTLAYQPVLGL